MSGDYRTPTLDAWGAACEAWQEHPATCPVCASGADCPTYNRLWIATHEAWQDDREARGRDRLPLVRHERDQIGGVHA